MLTYLTKTEKDYLEIMNVELKKIEKIIDDIWIKYMEKLSYGKILKSDVSIAKIIQIQ